jgi:hypothetical protein
MEYRIENTNVPLSGGKNAIIPMPIQVVIYDVGWWSGKYESKNQEPYRTGISRNHVPADYEAIAELEHLLSIRPQEAMVLCEWDKKNSLQGLPSSTWMSKNWNNSKWIGPWMKETADIIQKNNRYFELTLHGIGHEFWTGKKFTRAEWADDNGTMRPREGVEKQLDFFEKIMAQHKLGPFPVSFEPTAFNHGFGVTAENKISMADVLKKRAVTYINTPFSQKYNAKAAGFKFFGFDAGVMIIDRGHDLQDWNSIRVIPVDNLHGPTCGMHWANLIPLDPFRNKEIVKGWAKLLAPYNDKMDTILAPDSIFFQSQLVYHTCTKVNLTRNTIELDFKQADALSNSTGKNELTLKVMSRNAISFKANNAAISKHYSKMEGKSMVPALKDPTAETHQTQYWHYLHHHGGSGVVPTKAVRSGNWKLIEWHEKSLPGKEEQAFELYNLETDEEETTNQVDSLQMKTIELAGELQNWREEVNAQMPVPNEKIK